MKLREKMISVLEEHAKSHINKHVVNIEVFLKNPVGVGEHSAVMEAIEHELDMIGKYDAQLDALAKYFPKPYDGALVCTCDELNENCQCNS